MVKILLLPLLMTLIACPSIPTVRDTEQRSPVFVYVEIDGKEYIDVESSMCLSRQYRFNSEMVGPVTKSIAKSIKECDRVIGWHSSVEYPLVYRYWDEIRVALKHPRKESTSGAKTLMDEGLLPDELLDGQ